MTTPLTLRALLAAAPASSTGTVHLGMPYSDYNALPGVRSTDLKKVRTSPREYRFAVDKDTANRKKLRAIHTLALEPDNFHDDYCTFDGTRSQKEYKGLVSGGETRTLISAKEYDDANATAAALLDHPIIGPHLTGEGASEVTVTWTDEATGLPCKARLDRVSFAIPNIVGLYDIKTCGDLEPHRIQRMAHDLGWFIQLAHYLAGLRSIIGPDPVVQAGLLAAEGKGVQDATLFEVGTDTGLWVGECERAALLAKLKHHIDADTWPGRHTTPMPLDPPSWAYPNADGDLSELEED